MVTFVRITTFVPDLSRLLLTMSKLIANTLLNLSAERLELLEAIKQAMFTHFSKEEAHHDWYHIERVLNLSLYLQQQEGGDVEIIALTALLHDISDYKLNGGRLNSNADAAGELMNNLGYDERTMTRVCSIIDKISYKGAGVQDEGSEIELQIVRDADRLDAMGAIGIARAFQYGGSRNRLIFSPEDKPEMHASFEDYSKSNSHTMNHFHEKLLLLKDRLATKTAREIGEKRHALMQQFTDAFYSEWYFSQVPDNEGNGVY